MRVTRMNTVNESSQTHQQDNPPAPLPVPQSVPQTQPLQNNSVLVEVQPPASSEVVQAQPPQPADTVVAVQPAPTISTDPTLWQVVIIDDEPDNVGVAKLILEFNRAVV